MKGQIMQVMIILMVILFVTFISFNAMVEPVNLIANSSRNLVTNTSIGKATIDNVLNFFNTLLIPVIIIVVMLALVIASQKQGERREIGI